MLLELISGYGLQHEILVVEVLAGDQGVIATVLRLSGVRHPNDLALI